MRQAQKLGCIFVVDNREQTGRHTSRRACLRQLDRERDVATGDDRPMEDMACPWRVPSFQPVGAGDARVLQAMKRENTRFICVVDRRRWPCCRAYGAEGADGVHRRSLPTTRPRAACRQPGADANAKEPDRWPDKSASFRMGLRRFPGPARKLRQPSPTATPLEQALVGRDSGRDPAPTPFRPRSLRRRPSEEAVR